MRSTLALLLTVPSLACAGSWYGVRGSGHLIEDNREVRSPFRAIEVDGDVSLKILPGPNKILVRADDNILPLIETRVRGGTLRVGPKEDSHIGSATVEVTVWVPELSGVEISGACDVDSTAPTAAELKLEVSGSGKLKLAQVQSNAVRVEISGASDVVLSGKTHTLSLEVSGSSELKMAQLEVDTLDLSVSGASNIHAKVKSEVKGEVSGSSEIRIAGRPATHVDVSGSSTVVTE